MGIKFNNVKYKKENLNLIFESNCLTAVMSSSASLIDTIFDLIYALKIPESGEIKVNRKSIDNKTKKKAISILRNSISYLNSEYEKYLFNVNILEDIKYISGNTNLDELESLLKSFNLDSNILKKSYFALSKSEKKKIVLVSLLLKNYKILLLSNPDAGLDNKAVQNLIKILKRKKRDDKLIIVSSNNSDFLLQISDQVIVINEDEIIKGKKFEILSNEQLLNRINVKTPNTVMFVNKVLKLKGKKIGYRDNIYDLIKDIYRNVK